MLSKPFKIYVESFDVDWWMPRMLVGSGVQGTIIINDLSWVVTCGVTCDVPIVATIGCAPF